MLSRPFVLAAAAIAALALAGVAGASTPGFCPSGDPAATEAAAVAQLRAAGFLHWKGSCIHLGVYWGSGWHVDCTFLATAGKHAKPKTLPPAILTGGYLTGAGFYANQQLGGREWNLNYEAPETNACPVPQGTPGLPDWLVEQYG